MKLGSDIQGHLYELASKIGVFRAIGYLNKTERIVFDNSLNVKTFAIYEEIGLNVLKNKLFENLTDNFKAIITSSFFSFIRDIKRIKDKNSTINIKYIYFDDYISSIVDYVRINTNNITKFKEELNQVKNLLKVITNGVIPDVNNNFNLKGEAKFTDLIIVFETFNKKFQDKVDIKNILYVADFKNPFGFTENGLENYQSSSQYIQDIYYKQIANLKSETVLNQINTEIMDNINLETLLNKEKELFESYFSFLKKIDTNGIEKVIQASSYAYSFIKNIHSFIKEKNTSINLDTNFNKVFLKPYNLTNDRLYNFDFSTIENIKNIYKNKSSSNSSLLYNFENLYKSIFEGLLPDKFLNDLYKFNIDMKGSNFYNYEKLVGDKDYNILTDKIKKELHSGVISKNLDKNKNLLLLANPGIGKTHSSLLSLIQIDKPKLIIYASPRTAINQDFFKKVKDINEDIYKSTNKKEEHFILKIDSSNTNIYEIKNDGDNKKASKTSFIVYDSSIEDKEKVKEFFKEISDDKITFIDAQTFEKKLENLNNLVKSENSYVGEFDTNKNINRGVITKNKNNDTILSVLSIGIKRIFKSKPNSKVYVVLTLQALSKNSDSFFKAIKNINKETYFFLDEIAGEENGIKIINNLFHDIYENFHLILSDASLNSNVLFDKLLKDTKLLQNGGVFISKKNNLAKQENNSPVKEIPVELKLGKEFVAIETDSFPAQNLNIEYIAQFVNREIIEAEGGKEKELYTLKHEQKINLLTDLIMSNLNQKPIVYVQDKNILSKLEKILNEEGIKTVKFDSNTDNKEKINNIKKLEDNGGEEYEVALITSSSSRGISYPYSKTIIIDIQNFNIESGLMEIMQTVFRIRGSNDKVNIVDKKIYFIYQKAFSKKPLIDLNNGKDEREKASIRYQNLLIEKQNQLNNTKTILDVATIFSLTRISFLSRIGYKNQQIQQNIVPLGKMKNNVSEKESYQSLVFSILEAITKQGGDLILDNDLFKDFNFNFDESSNVDKYINFISNSIGKLETFLDKKAIFYKQYKGLISEVDEVGGFLVFKSKAQLNDIRYLTSQDFIKKIEDFTKVLYSREKKVETSNLKELLFNLKKQRNEQIKKDKSNQNGDNLNNSNKEYNYSNDIVHQEKNYISLIYPTFTFFKEEFKYDAEFTQILSTMLRDKLFTNDILNMALFSNFKSGYGVKDNFLFISRDGDLFNKISKRYEDKYLYRLFALKYLKK